MGDAMSLFLLTFFLLYSGVHVYTFFKVRQAIGFGAAAAVVMALFLLLMVLAPVLVRRTLPAVAWTAAFVVVFSARWPR